MDLFELLNLNSLSHGLANLSMFPFFDMAHYAVSVMSLREQPGTLEVSRRSPFACWFSSMLQCFGGAVLAAFMLAEPAVAPLSNGTNVLLASLIWYLIFYCPQDVVYTCAAIWPLRLVLTGMKEVTRTWKVLGGVAQAKQKYEDALLVMIAVGWAKGAGGGLISNFEQLVRGIWKPETNELLKMSYPTKVTLIGAVLFTLQQNHYLPLQTHHLMFLYTVFIVVNKTRMMLTGSSSSPFAPVEKAVYQTLFAGPSESAAPGGPKGAPESLNGATVLRSSGSQPCTTEAQEKGSPPGSEGQPEPNDGGSSKKKD